MDSRQMRSVFQRRLSFVCLSFTFLIFASSVQAEFRVEIQSNQSAELDKPVIITGTCQDCCIFYDLCLCDCPSEATWEWSVVPPFGQSDSSYELISWNGPYAILIPHAEGWFDVYATVQGNGDSGLSNSQSIWVVEESSIECPVSIKKPFVIYESPAFPGNDECDLDSDGNGLDDAAEQIIADCFVPAFAFDAGEECWSLSPEEPYVVYNMYVSAIGTGERAGAFQLFIRYGAVWQYDGGFQSSNICADAHIGDTQGLTVTAWLKKNEGTSEWVAELESIGGYQGLGGRYYAASPPNLPPEGPPWILPFPLSEMPWDWWMYRWGTHPLVYPTEGKHHFRPEAGEWSYGICTENAYGNLGPYRVPPTTHVPHFPSPFPAGVGPQGGPPIFALDGNHVEWSNACLLLKGQQADQYAPAYGLRPVDLQDWNRRPCFPLCMPISLIPDGDCCSLPLIPYESGLTGGPLITDQMFLCSDIADGIWRSVSGGFDSNLDSDDEPWWLDPCPVVANGNPDADQDGICDPLDICPSDPDNDSDGDGNCGSPPICNAGGPYTVECSGTVTDVQLNGLNSIDPEGAPLSFNWVTDCPGQFSDATSGIPYLSVNTSPGCAVNCSISLTVVDIDGAAAECAATVAIRDLNPPTISCADDQVLECSDPSPPSGPDQATVSDQCDEAPTVNYTSGVTAGACPNEWTLNRAWTAYDDCGNSNTCEQTISVLDTTAPLIECPANTVIQCDEPTDPSNTGTASATDNCNANPVISNFEQLTDPTPTCLSDYVITRQWMADDECGNSAQCQQEIRVEDTAAPLIECNSPASIIPPDAPVAFMASATDNCDEAPEVVVSAYDCYTITKTGKRTDKRDSCIVAMDGAVLTIQDSGGVGDRITWAVQATDCSGNMSNTECGVDVVNPAGN